MNLQRIGRIEHVIYDSLEELEQVALPLCKQHNMHAYKSSIHHDGFSALTWYGFNGDGNQAREKILHGWSELLERLRPMMSRLELSEAVSPHRAVVRRRKMKRGDHGDFLDINRVNSGELDTAWTRPKRLNLYGVTDRRATIVVNVSASADTKFDETLWRAATAIKICDLLQSSGRSVEIYSGNSARNVNYQTDQNAYCRIKEYLQPLQVERLAAMVSLAFLRTYMFIAIGAIKAPVDPGLGEPSDGMPVQLKARKDAGELVVELARCFSFGDAKRDLESVHKQLTGGA